MSFKQKSVIILAVTLAVLLYFAPKKLREKKPEETSSSLSLLVEEAKKNISSEQKKKIELFEGNANDARTSAEKIHWLDSLRIVSAQWKNLLLSSFYHGQIAELKNIESEWFSSGEDFYRSAKFVPDNPDKNIGTGQKTEMYRSAISSYEKALALNPNNLSAKTKLGVCYVESASALGNQPMKGISLLREVVQADSNNIEANLQLGFFSVTSRQFDKAIERFKKILKIDTTRIEMYVYLGDTYISMGEKQKAITSYEKYKTLVNDTLIKKDIEQYIKKLKTN